jgi:hypothetical protein
MHIDPHTIFVLVTAVAGIVVVLMGALVYAAYVLGTRTDRDYQAKRDSYLSGIR